MTLRKIANQQTETIRLLRGIFLRLERLTKMKTINTAAADALVGQLQQALTNANADQTALAAFIASAGQANDADNQVAFDAAIAEISSAWTPLQTALSNFGKSIPAVTPPSTSPASPAQGTTAA